MIITIIEPLNQDCFITIRFLVLIPESEVIVSEKDKVLSTFKELTAEYLNSR